MIQKILLGIVAVVVVILLIKNISFVSFNQATEVPYDENAFVASPLDYVQQQINADESQVVWFGENKIQAKSHTGTLKFNENASFIGLEPYNAEGDMKVVGGYFEIDMTTLAGANEPEMLINHLKSADFFDVVNFPSASFSIANVVEGAVKGTLTIRDVSEEVTIPYTLEKDGEVYRIHGELSIDRTKWGVTTLSANFFDDVKDSAVEDMISLDFIITTK